MKIKGKITISRVQGGDPDDHMVRVSLEDDEAGVRFAEARMALAGFAEAITGRGWVDCDIEVLGLDRVGTIREVKEQKVWVPDGVYRDNDKRIAEILAPHEVDGWKARSRDVTNHHRQFGRTKDGVFANVVFSRNVPKAKP